MLSRSNKERIHLRRQMPHAQEFERGRSRTPKPMAIVPDYRPPPPPPPAPPRATTGRRIPSGTKSHVARIPPRAGGRAVDKPRRHPPPKGKSPDRSIPGALEVAIHEAHARGDLRQSLQWVLEIQGIRLDWDDPRLDTATEDDLYFSEQTGMGPDATPEERSRAVAYWAMRQAEEDEKQRVWELTATPAEKEASRRLRAQAEMEQKKREDRLQFFRAPRTDKAVPPLASSSSLPQRRSTASRSLDSVPRRIYTIPRTDPSKPQELFPMDESELTAMRSMWLDQGRRGLPLVENLIRLPERSKKAKENAKASSPAVSTKRAEGVSPTSASSSSSSSIPSALFSSTVTTASTATSVSTITCPESPRSPDDKKSNDGQPKPREVPTTTATASKFIPVAMSESPLHNHRHVRTVQETPAPDSVQDTYAPAVSDAYQTKPEPPRRQRTASGSWLRTGSRTLEGFVSLVSRLPSAYLVVSTLDAHPRRSASCPPPSSAAPRTPRTPALHPESLLDLLPLQPPVHPLTFSPVPSLPRSPYRPLTPPTQPTPRARCVPNPQFLRLKALHNRVLWGSVSVARDEYDFLSDNIRRHRMDNFPGRPDVDRLGQMFTGREALMRFITEGVGSSKLRLVCATAPRENPGLWSWLRAASF